MKRTSARLVSKQSQTNSSVTSFHLEGASDGSGSESPKRPTKRIKSERVSTNALTTASEPSVGKGKGKAVEVPKESITTVAKSPRKKIKQIQQTLSKPHPAPTRWQEQYDAIKHMRSRIAAPVDTMGCDRAQYKETDPKVCIHFL
jgi:endonuclease-3